jgi:hypothetical protein
VEHWAAPIARFIVFAVLATIALFAAVALTPA